MNYEIVYFKNNSKKYNGVDLTIFENFLFIFR